MHCWSILQRPGSFVSGALSPPLPSIRRLRTYPVADGGHGGMPLGDVIPGGDGMDVKELEGPGKLPLPDWPGPDGLEGGGGK